MKIAIQGIVGSFHHAAAIKILGKDIELVPCDTFWQVFDTVNKCLADKGVVAIENNIHGSINEVYRMLAKNSLWVSAETSLKIEQYLIVARDLPISNVERVLSQLPAIAQCEDWLYANMPHARIEEAHDTADSVRYVMHHANEPLAAIAGKHAAELYGGKIIAGPINDEEHNYTRFYLIGREKITPKDATETSIILTTSHKPAALYEALGVFARENVNLTKLDSHPITDNQRRYAFYIDFDAKLDNKIEQEIFNKLRQQGCEINVLGSYKIIK